jgi:CheY-like chemotaxis protein
VKRPIAQPFDLLLVEDNPADADLAIEFLEEGSLAVQVHVVRDGDQAREYLERTGQFAGAPRPQLILLDLNLPRTDGRELLAWIKQDRRWCAIPVVVLSSSGSPADVDRSYDLAASCYLAKPVDLAAFEELVHRLKAFWLTCACLPP